MVRKKFMNARKAYEVLYEAGLDPDDTLMFGEPFVSIRPRDLARILKWAAENTTEAQALSQKLRGE